MSTETNWRDHLSNPPTDHTLPEMMILVLDIAAEDAASYSFMDAHTSARAEAAEKLGYDPYDAVRTVLDAMIDIGNALRDPE